MSNTTIRRLVGGVGTALIFLICGVVIAAHFLTGRNLQRIDGEILSIKAQLGEYYEVLPLSYIAKTFFGKSPAWLYQRINGIPVRGRVYSLNEEQKRIFNTAMEQLAKFYGSFRLA